MPRQRSKSEPVKKTESQSQESSQEQRSVDTNDLQSVSENMGMDMAREMLSQQVEEEQSILPDGVSGKGLIFVRGQQDLCATSDLIEEANAALRDQGAIVFKKGGQVDNPHPGVDTPLFEARPVLQDRNYLKEDGLQSTEKLDPFMFAVYNFSERESDTDLDVVTKQIAYHEWLAEQNKAAKELATTLSGLAHEFMNPRQGPRGGGRLDLKADLTNEQWRSAELAMMQWMQKYPHTSQFIDNIRLQFDTHRSIDGMLDFCKELQDVALGDMDGSSNLVLPTDCNTASRVVSDDNQSKTEENPDVGQTHYVDLGGGAGWVNHWGTVIMRDGDNSITLENAADPEKAPVDSSTWYYRMYGTGDSSFQTVMKDLHQKRVEEFARQGVTND